MTLGLDGSGSVDVVAGGYEDWERKRKPRPEPKSAAARKPETPVAAPPQRTKLSYKDQRDYDLLPARIEAIDAAITRDETALADPDLYTRDAAAFARLTKAIEAARAEKDDAETRWLALAEQVEALG